MQQPLDKLISMRDRWILAALVISLAVAICNTVSHLPLCFDGSYFLLKVLEEQAPFCPHNRFGAAFLQLPTLVTASLTQQLAPSLAVFCFSYSVVPLLALLTSWLVLRSSKPTLIAWPAIGILLLTPPAMPGFYGDGFASALFAWPLFLMTLTPPNKAKSALILTGSALLITLYPLTIIPLAVMLISTLLISKKNNKLTVQTIVIVAGLLALIVVRIYLTATFASGYEKEHLGVIAAVRSLIHLLKSPGGVLSALCSLGCGVCLFLSQRRQTSALFAGSLILAILSLLFSLYRAADFDQWWQFTSYPRFLPVFYIPLMSFAFIESLSDRSSTEISSDKTWIQRAIIVNVAAVSLLATCLVQGWKWSAATDALALTIRQNKQQIIEGESLSYQNANVLAFWSTPSLAIILQGRNPQKLLLTKNRIIDLNKTGDIYLTAWETPFKNKWFKLPKINAAPNKLP